MSTATNNRLSLGESLRNKAFYFLDKFKKNSVQGMMNDMLVWEINQNREYHLQQRLFEFIKEATVTTPYYRKFQNTTSLTSFPVMKKIEIIKNALYIRSVSYSDTETVAVHTSGSYGTPCSFYLSKTKKRRQWAEVLYYGAQSGYQVGVKHGYFRSNPPKSRLKFYLQNEYFFASKILDDTFAEKARQQLLSKKIKTIIGFPSAIAYLAAYSLKCEDKASSFSIEGIISCSENLTRQHRELIEKAFGVAVHNRYSTEELGVLGYQYEKDGVIHLNTAHYIFEILHLDRDEPVKKGELGRIVVTDLYSDAMPLIRYETGDLAVLEAVFTAQPTWATKLKFFSGRSVQVLLSTDDKQLYPLYFDTIMDNYPYFVQYQLIQESKQQFVINLVPNFDFKEEGFNKQSFSDSFKEWLGQEAEIKIQFQNDIEKLPSGKRPYVINRLN